MSDTSRANFKVEGVAQTERPEVIQLNGRYYALSPERVSVGEVNDVKVLFAKDIDETIVLGQRYLNQALISATAFFDDVGPVFILFPQKGAGSVGPCDWRTASTV